MIEDSKLIPRTPGSNGSVDVISASTRVPAIDLSPREPHLYDYLLILRKHQWLILSFLLTVVTVVSIATFRMRPVYIAKATIEIDRENNNILPFQGTDPYDSMMDLDNYIETQSKVLTSETLALQTIRNTCLAANPEFSAGGIPSEAIATGSLANQKRPPEVAAFLGSLSVKRIPSSRLMEVSYESTDPVLAARILNAHLENYKAQNIQSRYEATLEATRFLTSQLNELKLTVKQSEDARINYERQNQIWSVDDKSNITTQRLADLDKQLTDAQGETLKKQALYEYAKAGDIDAVPEIRADPLLQDLQKKRADLAVQYTEALNQYGPNFPKVQRLQAQMKEAGISEGLKSSNLRVVDPAMIPSFPARPAKARNIALAFLVGLVGGIGLALLREYLDNTVKTPDDIETLTRLPSLAVVPAFGDSLNQKRRMGIFGGASTNGHEKRIELVAQHLPKSQMSEAFRALRTALLLSQPDRPPQVILVTSALPREGKTTAAANLAVTLAQLGDKTVLVDADLRKPGIGRLLNLGSGKYAGLSSYLAGVSSLDLVTVPHPAIPNLVAIPTGPLPPNPADLLSSHKLVEAIAELRTKFKFIVIDSPPIMA